jgi:hypothetical protein
LSRRSSDGEWKAVVIQEELVRIGRSETGSRRKPEGIPSPPQRTEEDVLWIYHFYLKVTWGYFQKS